MTTILLVDFPELPEFKVPRGSLDKRQLQCLGEMVANTCLARRHLEDARMRLGKVLQWHDGGTSIYDKKGATDAQEAEAAK